MDQAAKNGNIRDDLSGCLYGCDVVIADNRKADKPLEIPEKQDRRECYGSVYLP